MYFIKDQTDGISGKRDCGALILRTWISDNGEYLIKEIERKRYRSGYAPGNEWDKRDPYYLLQRFMEDDLILPGDYGIKGYDKLFEEGHTQSTKAYFDNFEDAMRAAYMDWRELNEDKKCSE